MEELKKENASLKAKLQSLSTCSLCRRSLEFVATRGDDSLSALSGSTTSSDPKEPLDDQDFAGDDLTSRFSQVSLESMRTTYLGPGSSFALADNVIALKEKYLGPPSLIHSRRALFWDMLPASQWEKEAYAIRPLYIYPENDLISSLLKLYFANVHPTIPILHRPSFERSVAEGLHLTDTEFGGTLLSVLAIASRVDPLRVVCLLELFTDFKSSQYSNDPRVFVESDVSGLSSGWRFANQIRILPKSYQPTIHEVQMYCLLNLFMLGTSMPQVSWMYLGLGIRCLLQHGEHRRKPGNRKPNSEDELWKRAFWVYVALERMLSICMGRPAGLHTEDYDLELPLEVDDEYWDSGFTQPVGQPSQLSYFVILLRLFEILGDFMRRLYGSRKSKIRMGWDGPDWEQRTVSEFDSGMNEFLDSIPPHLRWDPKNPPEGTFFDQSAILHITYHYVLIAIHRPYIQKKTLLSATSLSLCASAARTILHTADIWLTRLQRIPLPSLINPVFISGIILVLNMLKTKRAGLPNNKDLALLATAMEILKFAESRLQPIGRLCELLRELWFLDGPLPLNNPPNKDLIPVGTGLLSEGVSWSPPSNGSAEDRSQFAQSFWNESDQTLVLGPGMSIEQLLAEPLDSMMGILNDELMSTSRTVSTDNVPTIDHWNAYLENFIHDPGANTNSFSSSGTQGR
ncbi:Zn(2)-C6 fungal-type domain-containing protein [Mycena venus]|uniref:Zn(2)-C6 fungal-type domain-containing protein n=1 Tax=Mycena venus TaxID=2733690 RepID=A0A8H6X9D5_9AGAR|nr:Zn(2)-C6 fungal-type domain-containing protein [Mycena venus]